MKRLRWVAVSALVAVTAFGLFWVVRARRALDDAQNASNASNIPFVVHNLSRSPASVDFLPAPPDFRDGQLFRGHLYLCGSGGVWAYDLAGKLQATYLVGRDLPPSPPVAMAVGTLAGDGEPKLWIGTAAAGLLVFDGTSFSQIELKGTRLGNITSLLMLPTGVLLIGFSQSGVVAFDGTKVEPFHSQLSPLSVTALAGTEGDLWIGTREQGVVHWQGGSTEEFHDRSGLPDKHVVSVATSDDRTFVGTPVGIAEFRGGQHVRTIAEGVFGRTLLPMADRLLIGTVDEGVVEVSLTSQKSPRLQVAAELQPRNTRRLVEIQGTPFVITAGGVFEQVSRTGLWTERIAAAAPNLTDRNISALSVDALGKLWIGYFDRGIDIADNGGMRNPEHIEDDQIFCVNRIVPDPHRNVHLVATANGLVMFSPQGKVVRRMTKKDGLISDHVSDIAVAPEGIAVATAAGVTLLDQEGPQSIYAFHGLANNHVYALGQIGPRLVAGTLGGLSLIQDGFVRASYNTSNSPLKQNWISGLVSLGDAIFIGTYGGGVIQMLPDGSWIEFPDMPANVVVNPNAMLAVANRVVAGTLDRGLLVFNPDQHRWLPVADGLPSLNVTALAASSGKLFVGTDNGIVTMALEGLLR